MIVLVSVISQLAPSEVCTVDSQVTLPNLGWFHGVASVRRLY